ncbi:hypothetical protein T459_34840 [Capsicum annuum]|uniref:Terpene synthase metal-binding domain-containing protein n=1 Tax=Capsicum annuum TaxID=4072 RepID=A0A2G2XUV7_CAPAN|nr:hypothetical protein T459_34840 [Capsicum annuum]
MENAIVSSGYMMAATTCLIGMKKFISRETFEWLRNEPLIVRASSLISRAMDHIVGHEVELGMNDFIGSTTTSIESLQLHGVVFVVLLADIVGGVGICVFGGGVGGLGVGIGGIGGGIGCGVGGSAVATGGRFVERY